MSTKCMNPFRLSEQNGSHLVPCGKCLPCKSRRASSWSVRLNKEGERSHTAYFLTLTYDTKYIPITDKGFLTLNKKDVQKFIKRLRKLHPLDHKTIKYYAVGEYGGVTKRPHYHLIIFNADINNFQRAWALDNKKIGEIHVGQVSEASIGYSLKYITKTSYIGKDQKKDDRQPQFSLMSKGLGNNYLTPNMIQWHKNKPEERVYVPLTDGKKAPLPRYYKLSIYNESEKERIAYHYQKLANIETDTLVSEHGNNLPSFLKEKLLHSNNKMTKNINSQL